MDAGASKKKKPFAEKTRDPKCCGDKFLSLFFPLLLCTPVFAGLEGREKKTEAPDFLHLYS